MAGKVYAVCCWIVERTYVNTHLPGNEFLIYKQASKKEKSIFMMMMMIAKKRERERPTIAAAREQFLSHTLQMNENLCCSIRKESSREQSKTKFIGFEITLGYLSQSTNLNKIS
jgi:hypothetical protein